MFSESPELYDLIYGSFKDYSSEAAAVARLLQEVAPECRTILDVGCGTGEHARELTTAFGYEVHGLDIEPGFIERARSKLPESSFWQADMAAFSVGGPYDVVLCLFSSIGYVVTVERLQSALASFRTHLEPGGVAVVEPWFEPGGWSPGRVFTHSSESDDLSVVRMSHSGEQDGVSVLDFHYLIGTSTGIEHRTERHELGLFSKATMLEAFEKAGFDHVTHDPEGLVGRGLYVARVAPTPEDQRG